MTTSRERVIATLSHQPVDRAPRDLWIAPAVEQLRGEEVAELLFRFPMDIERPDFNAPPGMRARGTVGNAEGWTDAWGCFRDPPGTSANLPHRPLLASAAEAAAYQPPRELLEQADWSRVNRGCAATSRFVLAWSDVRPADRLRWLCGSPSALAALESGQAEIRQLLSRIHKFACAELEAWARTDVDGVAFQDEGPGAVEGLTADLWREVFRPLYHDYCAILHAADKFAFFRCGTSAHELLDDLIEAGVDAVHINVDRLDISSLASAHRGQITFWGPLDPQLLAPTTPAAAVRAAIETVRTALDFGSGGLIAQGTWELSTPLAHLVAAFDAWARSLPASERHIPGSLRRAV